MITSDAAGNRLFRIAKPTLRRHFTSDAAEKTPPTAQRRLSSADDTPPTMEATQPGGTLRRRPALKLVAPVDRLHTPPELIE